MVGLLHLVSAILSMLLGSLVLYQPKGTKKHRRIGYAYFYSMLTLNGTAFLIYELFGGFGIFHISAMLSLLTIFLGMIPVWRRQPVNNWRGLHAAFMYWSVIGLYAAFWSETLTRIPETPFFGMVGLATGLTILLGFYFFKKYSKNWAKRKK